MTSLYNPECRVGTKRRVLDWIADVKVTSTCWFDSHVHIDVRRRCCRRRHAKSELPGALEDVTCNSSVVTVDLEWNLVGGTPLLHVADEDLTLDLEGVIGIICSNTNI